MLSNNYQQAQQAQNAQEDKLLGGGKIHVELHRPPGSFLADARCDLSDVLTGPIQPEICYWKVPSTIVCVIGSVLEESIFVAPTQSTGRVRRR